MNAPRLRAWNPDLKIMELPEEIFTRENIHMLLNKKDYEWMRSTDYFDKNEKEIFEGDFLYKGYYVIYKNCKFLVTNGEHDYPLFIFDRCNLPVIGNIYENPELMGERKC